MGTWFIIVWIMFGFDIMEINIFMDKILVKVILFVCMFFVISSYAVTGQEDDKSDCYNGDNAPFGANNIRMASKDIEFIDSAEDRASSFHYQREFAYEAIINARSNNDKINSLDLVLIKDCPNIDREYPTMIQLHGCMETLHDKMEDELAVRFKTIKMWEKNASHY